MIYCVWITLIKTQHNLSNWIKIIIFFFVKTPKSDSLNRKRNSFFNTINIIYCIIINFIIVVFIVTKVILQSPYIMVKQQAIEVPINVYLIIQCGLNCSKLELIINNFIKVHRICSNENTEASKTF